MKPSPSPSSSPRPFSSSLLRKNRHSPYLFVLFPLILFITTLYSKNLACIFSGRFDSSIHSNSNPPRLIFPSSSSPAADVRSVLEKKVVEKLAFAIGKGEEDCDLFVGKWVWDESRPLYEEHECPYIQPQLTCQEHGRPDKDYRRWRWQPHGCSLHSFNATLLLESLRGKRMMFVGDSLNRGQYVSMICLLHSLIPHNAKSMETFGSSTVFTAKDYNATIEFYWAPFLLESNSDDPTTHRINNRIVRKGSINKHGKHWIGADIIIFNTYLWWVIGPEFKILKGPGSFEDEKKDIVQVATEDAYGVAMKSMLRWVDRNMDPKRTRVFFTSMSPSHGIAETIGVAIQKATVTTKLV